MKVSAPVPRVHDRLIQRTFAFGDIHGDYAVLTHLLTQVFRVARVIPGTHIASDQWFWTTRNTRVLSCGDFVDRFRPGVESDVNSLDAMAQERNIINCFLQLMNTAELHDNEMRVLCGNHEFEYVRSPPEDYRHDCGLNPKDLVRGENETYSHYRDRVRMLHAARTEFLQVHLLPFLVYTDVLFQEDRWLAVHGGMTVDWLEHVFHHHNLHHRDHQYAQQHDITVDYLNQAWHTGIANLNQCMEATRSERNSDTTEEDGDSVDSCHRLHQLLNAVFGDQVRSSNSEKEPALSGMYSRRMSLKPLEWLERDYDSLRALFDVDVFLVGHTTTPTIRNEHTHYEYIDRQTDILAGERANGQVYCYYLDAQMSDGFGETGTPSGLVITPQHHQLDGEEWQPYMKYLRPTQYEAVNTTTYSTFEFQRQQLRERGVRIYQSFSEDAFNVVVDSPYTRFHYTEGGLIPMQQAPNQHVEPEEIARVLPMLPMSPGGRQSTDSWRPIRIVRVPGDGNCFYSSIRKATAELQTLVTGWPTDATTLRQELVTFARRERSRGNPDVEFLELPGDREDCQPSQCFESLMKQIGAPKAWVEDQRTVQLAALWLRRMRIHLGVVKGSPTRQPYVVPADTPTDTATVIVIYNNAHDNHFEPLSFNRRYRLTPQEWEEVKDYLKTHNLLDEPK